MNSSKTCLLIAALAAGSAAQAQAPAAGSNVTLYGVLNPGLVVVNNVGASGATVKTMPPNSGGTTPSGIGVRGSENLGGNLRAIFNFEMGMDFGTGSLNQGGRAWGRQAYVGLEGPFGSFTLGRQYTMTFWNGVGRMINGSSVFGIGSLDAYFPNARADNSLVWRGKFDKFSFGAQYSLGRDAITPVRPNPAANNCGDTLSGSCRQWSVLAAYDDKDWGAAISYDDLNGRNLGAAPDAIFGGLNSPDKHDRRTLAEGWVAFGPTRLNAGISHRRNDGAPANKTSNLYFVAASYAVTPAFVLSGQAMTLRYSADSNFNASLLALRGTYILSKRTSVAAQIGHIRNGAKSALSVSGGTTNTIPLAGANQTGFNVSVEHRF